MTTIAEKLIQAKALHGSGELAEALALYREILAADASHIEAGYLCGAACFALAKPEEAATYLADVIRRDPDHVDAHHHLGVVLVQLDRLDEAISSFERALVLRPGSVGIADNLRMTRAAREKRLGDQWIAQDKLDEAADCFRRAIELHPESAEAHNGLGAVFERQERWEEAAVCCQRAIALDPSLAEAHYNLGVVFDRCARLEESAASLRKALQFNPDFVEAHYNLGIVLRHQGVASEAIDCFRRALELRPDYAAAHNNILAAIQYQPQVTLASLAEAHAQFQKQHAAPLRAHWRAHENTPDAERNLRLGFVSADFGFHPVGYFLVRVLEILAERGVATVCYSDRRRIDGMTERLRAAAGTWHSTRELTDEQLAEQIRADRIDILFDLAGQVDGNRLLAFARKPSPLAITWIGYVGTTGVEAIDYLLADRFQVPPSAEPFIHERVIRLPDGYVCYEPPGTAPDVTLLPALTGRPFTFGCFNNTLKITPPAMAAWAEILRRLPSSRLLLKYMGMNDAAVVRRLTAAFAARGVDASRLEFQGWSQHTELLAEYGRVDLALDTFPYSGGLTTCEALWMGVPVVTLPGETFASRHSLSHLSNVGLLETIAVDWEDYVNIAVRLAGDLPRLAGIRSRLRKQMAASPLCDGHRFVDNLLLALREVWHTWCHDQLHITSGEKEV